MVDETDVQDGSNQQGRVNTDGYRKTSTVVEEFRDDPPFDPNNYESDELFKALSEIGKYSTECRGEIYKIAYKHFTRDLDSNEIDISDAVYLKQLKNYIEETQPEWAGSLGGFCNQFFESIEKSNFISGDTQKAIDDRISPNTARNYLEKRGEKLSEAVESAYGSAKEPPNVELIEEAQKAYLWNIWDCIDNSKIEDKPKLVSRNIYVERKCQSCGRKSDLVGKYDILLCRECFREMARDMGFKKYR